MFLKRKVGDIEYYYFCFEILEKVKVIIVKKSIIMLF